NCRTLYHRGRLFCANRHFLPSVLPPPPKPTLFPYTTLFRSADRRTIRCCSYGLRRARIPWQGGSPSHASGTCPSACWTSGTRSRSEEHTSELQSRGHLVCRLLLEKKNQTASSTVEAAGGPRA